MSKYIKGEEVKKNGLTRYYGHYWEDVLTKMIDEQRTPEGRDWLQAKEDLPDLATYKQMETAFYTKSVYELLEDAFQEIQSLAEEMEEWSCNMPESLQGGEKACAIEEAQAALESIQSPDIDEQWKSVSICWLPPNVTSRY